MADNTLVLCGGTGAHVALSFLRLHTLGYALGYFQRGDGFIAPFPELFLVDQDAGDGTEAGDTAWQTVRRLLDHHPGRWDWPKRMGREQAPVPLDVRPLPMGRNNDWYKPPFDTLAARFASSPLLLALTAKRQREVEYSKGMMGSPALGSLLFKLKEYDQKEKDINCDERFGRLLAQNGRVVVAGSGMGGTGAAVTPTLAKRLAAKDKNAQVMAVILLSWFEFNEAINDRGLKERAAIKNRILRQNAHSSLQYCGVSLAESVATVPVGMPDNALVQRDFTADFGQPVCESFSLYVAALSAFRQFTNDQAYKEGLYAMGGVERGRLDGKTPIPGGTLQDLINRSATLLDLLTVWQRMLATNQIERILPTLYAKVAEACEPSLVATSLGKELGNYREQLDIVSEVLGLTATILPELTFEHRSRSRLTGEGKAPSFGQEPSPEQVALTLFHWAADWVRETAAPTNVLLVQSAPAKAGHWPDLQREGISAPIQKNGDLNRVPDANINVVLEAFVDPGLVSANGWPHPLAAAHFFKHAIRHEDPTAWRQLELILVGLASRLLVVRPLPTRANPEPISLEAVVKEGEREEGFQNLAQLGVFLPSEAGGERLIAFNSPFTVFAPVPFLDDAADNALWQSLWERLTGAEDGENWAKAARRERWKEEAAVRVVRAWLEREIKVRGADGPVWTKLFESSQAGSAGARFGAGPSVKVHWQDDDRQLVEMSLPTGDSTGDWMPPAGTPERAESDLFSFVPELQSLSDAQGKERFSLIDFEMPDQAGTIRGLWQEHLEELQHEAKIFAFGQMANNRVVIGSLVNGDLRQTVLTSCLILRRSLISVKNITPLIQRPIPGSKLAEGAVLYPDLPLKPEFFDLVFKPSGARLLEAAKGGDGLRDVRWRPTESVDRSGRPMVTWVIPMRGRTEPLSIPISLEGAANNYAHWMIWPRFRSASAAGWRAYYLYDFCRNPNLHCDVLWLEGNPKATDPKTASLRLRRRQDPTSLTEALEFRASAAEPGHIAGPPVALSVRNHQDGEPRGLYLIGLDTLTSAPVPLNVAIDFGTSHSVAAFESGGNREALVFPAELDPLARDRALSLHVSEDREHLAETGGLEESGNWLPNYRRSMGSMIPSELVLYRNIDLAKSDVLTSWEPLRHYTIPPLDLKRKDLGQAVVSGFKWDASSAYFQGREAQLREHYLGLFFELVMAEIAANRLRVLPDTPVRVTFCYPLRSQPDNETFRKVLARTTASTGILLELFEGIGLLDESRAAAVRTGTASEVCLVADLGGGTLDLLISSWDDKQKPLREVADSVRVGGNVLLRKMIEASTAYLPRNGGWDVDGEAKLLAWIRGLGASELWGSDSGGRKSLPELGLTGFDKPAAGDKARKLLNRYFQFIVEFLARNLAAYLVGEWYPHVPSEKHPALRLTVQLRGNGWRLRQTQESDVQRAQSVQDAVLRRLVSLWPLIPGTEYPLPADALHWLPSSRFPNVDPKTAPVKGALGQAMSYEAVRTLWYTQTLVDLELIRPSGVTEIPWISEVPFESGGEKRVQLQSLRPALPLDPPGVDQGTTIEILNAEVQGQVNRALQQDGRIDGTRFSAPVSAEVWEALFRSPEFWPHERG